MFGTMLPSDDTLLTSDVAGPLSLDVKMTGYWILSSVLILLHAAHSRKKTILALNWLWHQLRQLLQTHTARRQVMDEMIKKRWAEERERHSFAGISCICNLQGVSMLIINSYAWTYGWGSATPFKVLVPLVVLYAAQLFVMLMKAIPKTPSVIFIYVVFMAGLTIRSFMASDFTFFMLRGVVWMARFAFALIVMDIRISAIANILCSFAAIRGYTGSVHVFRADAITPSSLYMFIIFEFISCIIMLFMVSFIERILKNEARVATELDDMQHGLRRILTALCDVVLELDDHLCIQNPTPQLYSMFYGNRPGSPSELKGRKVIDFFPSIKGFCDFQQFICASAEQKWQGSGSDAPASARTLEMANSQGKIFSAQMFHANLSGRTSGPSHVIGICHQLEDSNEAQPYWSVHGEMPRIDQVTMMMMTQNQNHAYAYSESSPESVDPEDTVVLGVRSLTFDAGSPRFEIMDGSQFFQSSDHVHRDLLDLIPADSAAAFEDWVEKVVQLCPPNRSSESEQRSLSLEVRSPTAINIVSSKQASLLVPRLDIVDSDRMPVTLKLRNVRMQCMAASSLHTISEVNQDIDVTPSDSVSEVGMQQMGMQQLPSLDRFVRPDQPSSSDRTSSGENPPPRQRASSDTGARCTPRFASN
eukprot:gnl/TRDRNA2_/TRDRNA2_175067_c0_seq1.p1 gnl/TRDRNA2_/TRDRNA2_175067_c0~~gnl/TRDRNA2_/TRDRNA2_175067_c0_seq1.p1  ORF type:complete len:645 (-),score=66.19 gnl/TRDRNA2_/TRDRNA2_175067_c0_seq1:28-1962(-)